MKIYNLSAKTIKEAKSKVNDIPNPKKGDTVYIAVCNSDESYMPLCNETLCYVYDYKWVQKIIPEYTLMPCEIPYIL